MAYLLDADVFIRAKRDHYRFSICPGFWDWILQANDSARVFSIVQVQRELTAGNDDLSTWAAARSAAFFLPTTDAVVAAAGSVSTWANSQHYEPQALAEFFRAADFWLVAHALATGWCVATHEVSAPASRKRIKLPDACTGVGVSYTMPYQLLEDEGAQFIL